MSALYRIERRSQVLEVVVGTATTTRVSQSNIIRRRSGRACVLPDLFEPISAYRVGQRRMMPGLTDLTGRRVGDFVGLGETRWDFWHAAKPLWYWLYGILRYCRLPMSRRQPSQKVATLDHRIRHRRLPSPACPCTNVRPCRPRGTPAAAISVADDLRAAREAREPARKRRTELKCLVLVHIT